MNHGLNERQLGVLKSTLSPYNVQAGLFGSRATGTYQPNSDIDLVLYGEIEKKHVSRLYTLFQESSLPVHVDVVAYNHITFAPLKAHIDAVMQPLF